MAPRLYKDGFVEGDPVTTKAMATPRFQEKGDDLGR
jgi:hypothetical protein